MTLLGRQLFKLVYLLNSERGTDSIAAGLALGIILGFSPTLSLQSLLVMVVVLVFRVQVGAALLSTGFFKLLAPGLTPVFHTVGDAVLSIEFLLPVYRSLYTLPLVPMTRFYNTVVTGAGICALVLAPVGFLFARRLIARYRTAVMSRLKNSRWWTLWKSTALYKWYQRYRSLTG